MKLYEIKVYTFFILEFFFMNHYATKVYTFFSLPRVGTDFMGCLLGLGFGDLGIRVKV